MPDLFDMKLGAKIITTEAGWVNDPTDRGGETIWGITVAVARENGYTGAMKDMTKDQALAIYRAKYYAKPGIYLIAALSEIVAAELFDTGVNAGTGTAGMMFQRALNGFNQATNDYAQIGVDGAIGNGTASAFKAYLRRRGGEGEKVMVAALNHLQGARYFDIVAHDPSQAKYIYGWISQRTMS